MIQHSFHKKSAGSWFFTSRSQLQSFKSFSWLFRCWKVFDLFKFLTCSTGSISALRPSYTENWCIWGDVRKKLPWCCSPANPTISFIWHMHTYVMNWKSLDWIWLDLDWFFSSSLIWYVFTWTRSCMVNLNISAPQLTLDRPPFAWAWTAQLGPQFRFVSNSAYLQHRTKLAQNSSEIKMFWHPVVFLCCWGHRPHDRRWKGTRGTATQPNKVL